MSRLCLVLLVGVILFSSLGESRKKTLRYKDASARVSTRDNNIPTPKQYFYENLVDHYSFVHPDQKYQMRYLVANDYWQGEG